MQPLYLPHLRVPGEGMLDVLFVATEHDGVYAFDANERGATLWPGNRHVFVRTGNGAFGATSGRDCGDTILKLALD